MRYRSYIPFFIFSIIIAVLAWHVLMNKKITQQLFNLNEVEIILGEKQLKFNDDLMFVYIFSPKCGKCQASFEKIKELRKFNKKILGIVIDEDRADIESMKCWQDGIFDAIGRISKEEAYFFDVNALPDILLVKNQGDIILRNKTEFGQEFEHDNLQRLFADASKN